MNDLEWPIAKLPTTWSVEHSIQTDKQMDGAFAYSSRFYYYYYYYYYYHYYYHYH